MFSVIVPVYNTEKTLRRCVESLLSGSDRDIELILVEDSSGDGSWALCQALAETYENVTALRNSPNGGVSRARNRGLDAARGEYILFCDSDDWVDPEWSASLLNAARKAPHRMPICGFYVEDDMATDAQLRLWNQRGTVQQIPLEQGFDLLDRTLLQQLWTKAFRRDIIERYHIRFDETQSMGEDLQFVLDYLATEQLQGFSVISEPLYHYSCNTGTLMRNFGLANREEEYRRVRQLGEITGEQARCTATVEQLKKSHVYHILRSNLSRKEKRALAREILGENASAYCRAQKFVMLKEQITNLYKPVRRK